MTNEAKYTPGPWMIRCGMIMPHGCGPKSPRKIAAILCSPKTCNVSQQDANARLISAAPEMAEALLTQYKKFFELGEPDTVPHMVAARAALQKAGLL